MSSWLVSDPLPSYGLLNPFRIRPVLTAQAASSLLSRPLYNIDPSLAHPLLRMVGRYSAQTLQNIPRKT